LYTREDIKRIVEEKDVRFIRLQFTDIFGNLKNVAITRRQLERALNNQCMFDGSSIEGFVRIEESDMCLYPDLNSFAILPWDSKDYSVARLICDVYTHEGKAFAGDPRNVLKRALERAKKMGFDVFNVGPELEFFLFCKDENGRPTTVTHDQAGYFDLAPIDLGEGARREIALTLEEMGFEIEASHHECGYGQHEIDFKYDDALRAADNIMTFKLVVKSVASRHGLHATFMPKPLFGIAGSGMHINMSLMRGNENAFYDENDRHGLSKTAYNFIAGILKHAPGFVAVTNPLVNSYKRLVPDYEAPVYIAWSAQNRSPLVRIPAARGAATRLELRSPDPSANPYLSLAVALTAGLDGIEKGLTPPDSVDMNIYNMTAEERKAAGVGVLPLNLNEAVDALENDALICEALGEHVCGKYIEAKRLEWNEYRTRVHQWELDQYLTNY